MIVLYKTVLKDPKGIIGWYYGIHQTHKSDRVDDLWSEDNPEGYIGSGMLFHTSDDGHLRTLKPGWVHISTEFIKEVSSYDLGEERDLIKSAWNDYGVHPQVRAWAAAHGIRMPYKDGIVLNCQSTSAENLWPSDGRIAPCNTEEALQKKSESLRRKYIEDPSYRANLSAGIKKAIVEDPSIVYRAVNTKLKKYGRIPGRQEAVEAARAKEVRLRAVKTRQAHAIQWKCLDRPEVSSTSMRQLSQNLGLGLTAYHYQTKHKDLDCFTYKGMTFVKL